MKGNARRLVTLATAVVIIALMSVVDVSTKALAPWLSRAKRVARGWARRFERFGELRAHGAALLTALLLCQVPAIAGGASLTEGGHAAAFLLTEVDDDGNFCRDQVVVTSGSNLKAGAVVAYVNMSVGKADIPAVVGGGNGVMSALFAGPDVEKGNYLVKCTVAAANNGTFSVTTPSGRLLPNAVMAAGSVVYRSSHINFTITDGAADFVVNDLFTIAVAAGNPTVVGTGNGTLTAVTLGRAAKTGRYLVINRVAAANSGTFEIIAPTGESLGQKTITGGAGGTAVFSNGEQLNCTVTDGGNDFVVGDFFEVFVWNELVPAGSRAAGKVVAWDPTTFDGRQIAAGILYADTDATLADKQGVIIARAAEVIQAQLVWGAAITAAQQYAALKQLASIGIVAR